MRASRAAASRSRVDHQRLVQRAADLPARIERRARVLVGVLQAAAHGAPGGRRQAGRSRWPSNRISPAVGLWMPMMALPSVDLPQPDSPTSPKTSPGIRSNETPSTALIEPMRRLNGPRTGKWTCRSPRLRIGAGAHGALARGADDSSAPSARRRAGRRAGAPRGTAPCRAARSAGGSGSRRAARSGPGPRPGSAGSCRAASRQAGEQLARVGMGWCAKKRSTGADLDLLAGIHDVDAVADLVGRAEVVRGQQHGDAALLRERARIRPRICAWMVTSSAVVGSSAMIRSGPAAAPSRSSAAGAGRRRTRADTCAASASGRGICTASSSSSTASPIGALALARDSATRRPAASRARSAGGARRLPFHELHDLRRRP